MKPLNALWALLLSQLMFTTALADEVYVAVAANFTAAAKDIAAQFEQDTGHKAILSFGSSGKFFAQIQHGAPFQVFLSADQAKPQALEDAQLVAPGSRFTYAVGKLALWSSKPGLVDKNHSALQTGDFNKLALANPKLAPYGAAAVQVLQQLDLIADTQARWVQGENIAQTYQFVASGNADLGFVALSQIMAKGHIKTGSSWIIPDQLYNPIRQDAVLLKSAQDNAAAKTFIAYLNGAKARDIIHSYGYQTQ